MKIESVRFEPVIPVCEAAMLTTGLARESQQTSNNIIHFDSFMAPNFSHIDSTLIIITLMHDNSKYY